MSYDPSLLYRTVRERILNEPSMSLDNLARELRVCRRTVTTSVETFSGLTFREFRGRVIAARICTLLLKDPSASVKELAFANGYKSPRSFARAVRRTCGKSPHELRASLMEDFANEIEPPIDHRKPTGLSVLDCERPESPDDYSHDEEPLFVPMRHVSMSLLRRYEEFTGAERKAIVSSALQQMFQSHREFWTWMLKQQASRHPV